MAFEIRRFRCRDSIIELTELLHRSYRALAEGGMRYNASHQRPWKTWWRLFGGECWIAYLDGRLVGTVLFRSPAKTRGAEFFDRPGTASFHQFAVDPSAQGSGIGSRLLTFVEERARALGADAIALDTAETATDLIQFYQRRGYEQVGTADFRSTNYRSVLLAKGLSRPSG